MTYFVNFVVAFGLFVLAVGAVFGFAWLICKDVVFWPSAACSAVGAGTIMAMRQDTPSWVGITSVVSFFVFLLCVVVRASKLDG